MKSRLKSLIALLLSLPARLAHFLTSSEMRNAEQAAEEIAHQVVDLLPYAVRAVDFVASVTPNQNIKEIARLFDLLGVSLGQLPAAISPTTANALLSSAATTALHKELNNAIAEAGGEGVKIGDLQIDASSEVAAPVLDAAVQNAYTFAVHAAKKSA